jgi:hypothetical protein
VADAQLVWLRTNALFVFLNRQILVRVATNPPVALPVSPPQSAPRCHLILTSGSSAPSPDLDDPADHRAGTGRLLLALPATIG